MSSSKYTFTDLETPFVLWNHDINDKKWDLDSYREIIDIKTIEDYWIYVNQLHNKLINYGMFFLMKKGILPTWEDLQNIKGGCISIKLPLKQSVELWRIACKYVVSNSLIESDAITGISISPKNTFNIIKIWFNKEIDMEDYILPDEFKLENNLILFRVHKVNIEKDKDKDKNKK